MKRIAPAKARVKKTTGRTLLVDLLVPLQHAPKLGNPADERFTGSRQSSGALLQPLGWTGLSSKEWDNDYGQEPQCRGQEPKREVNHAILRHWIRNDLAFDSFLR